MIQAAEEAQAHLRRSGIEREYIIIHPIGRPDLPGYPTEFWSKVVRGVLDADSAISIVVTAGQGERDAGLNLVELSDRPGRIALIDTLSPNGVSELLRTARCFVSSASDGAHLAALVRTPVVALYPGAPPNWPQRRRPIGPHVTTLIPERNEPIPEGMKNYGENPETVLARIQPQRIIDAILRVRT
jgi:ADP-heptose:LPS heptosyltransferase